MSSIQPTLSRLTTIINTTPAAHVIRMSAWLDTLEARLANAITAAAKADADANFPDTIDTTNAYKTAFNSDYPNCQALTSAVASYSQAVDAKMQINDDATAVTDQTADDDYVTIASSDANSDQSITEDFDDYVIIPRYIRNSRGNWQI